MGSLRAKFTVMIIGLVTIGYNACSPVKFATSSSSDDLKPLCTASDLSNCTAKEKTIAVRAPTTDVDVLVIVDDSGSMETEREKLGSRMKSFTDRLSGLDWQICVTTTSPNDSYQGNLYKFSNGDYVLNASSPSNGIDVDQDGMKDFNDVFLETLTNIQTTSGDEQGIAAAGHTIKNSGHNCFRDEAALAVVLISDEDERSAGGWPDTKSSDQWKALRSDNTPEFVFSSVQSRFNDDQKPFTYHSIVIRSLNDVSGGKTCAEVQGDQGHSPFYGRRYEEMSRQSGGIVGNICADDYGVEVSGFADRIRKTLQAVTLECAPVGNPVISLSAGNEPYSILGNKIVFNNPIAPGTLVTVKYYCGQ